MNTDAIKWRQPRIWTPRYKATSLTGTATVEYSSFDVGWRWSVETFGYKLTGYSDTRQEAVNECERRLTKG